MMNSEVHLQGTDPFKLFEAMQVGEVSHAYYLGYELSKAVTALQLGKTYMQDQALSWGFLTREDPPHSSLRRGRGESR